MSFTRKLLKHILPYGFVCYVQSKFKKPIHINQIPPVLYNREGKRVCFSYLRDVMWPQAPYLYNPDRIFFDRYNTSLDVHFYTHREVLNTYGNPSRKYAFFMESEGIVPDDYLLFYQHKTLHEDFNYIFTFSDKLLNDIPNARFCAGTATVWDNLYSDNPFYTLDQKTKNISICSSDKELCSLHIIRKKIAKECKINCSYNIDTFGTFDGGTYCRCSEYLKKYRFSIAIENYQSDYFFTEKLLNCFAFMTIPIYLGARKIGSFFNLDGIIQISEDDLRNLDRISKICSKEFYMERKEAIIDNFNRVLHWKKPEDFIFTEYLLKDPFFGCYR